MATQKYIKTDSEGGHPQGLDLRYEGLHYAFNLHTAWLNQERGAQGRTIVHSHDVYHLLLYTKGRNRFLLGSRAVTSQPGTLVMTDPGQPHDFGPVDPGRTAYHEILFTLDADTRPLTIPVHQMLSLYSAMTLGRIEFPVVVSADQFSRLDLLFQRMMAHLKSPGELNRFMSCRAIGEILAFVTEELYARATGLSLPVDSEGLVLARQYVDQHLSERLCIKDLAGLVHRSPAYFCRRFKACFDVSPIAYQHRLRVQAAQSLLRSTNLLCKEIAELVGYPDVYSFSRAFSRIAGQSPIAYRRNSADVMA